MVLSLFAHFWSYFLTNFDVWVLILKLMTCKALKNGKNMPKIADVGTFWTPAGLSGNMS